VYADGGGIQLSEQRHIDIEVLHFENLFYSPIMVDNNVKYILYTSLHQPGITRVYLN